MSVSCKLRKQKQLTPRQGTKTVVVHFCNIKHFETTYTPSGDENSTSMLLLFVRPSETTYAPPGDENQCPDSCFFISLVRNNLHPARGRKRLEPSFLAVSVLKQLTPRQGTKTASTLRQYCLMWFEITYTPSGDENLFQRVTRRRIKSCRKQLAPRQGTKKAPYPCG